MAIIRLLFLIGGWSTAVWGNTQTWTPTSGQGANNTFSSGGTSVGDDVAAGGGSTAVGTAGETLSINLSDTSPTGDQGAYGSVVLRVTLRAQNYEAGSDFIKFYLNDGSNTDISTNVAVSTAFATYENEYALDPSGGSWNYATLSALEAGIQVVDGGSNSNLSISVDKIEIFATYGADTTPPDAIADLTNTSKTINSATLSFTAPGDDGSVGKATSYEIRYRDSGLGIITEGNFAGSTLVSTGSCGSLAPATPGSLQNCTASGLPSGTTVYFAIKAVDDQGNKGALSNVITVALSNPGSDMTPPGPIREFKPVGVDANSVELSWIASGDDIYVGTATTYEIKYSATPISGSSEFASATAVTPPTPTPSGTIQSVLVTGLSPDTVYYFRMRVRDELAANWSSLSDQITIRTEKAGGDAMAPAAITDLGATTLTLDSVRLMWTAPGDNGLVGTASAYDIRYSTSPITNGVAFASATQATGSPAPNAPGTQETFVVTGLAASTTYYFSVRTLDEVPNTSPVSNSASAATESAGADTTPPADITDLMAGALSDTAIELVWTAVGDNGTSGGAASYEIRYNSTGITNSTDWNSANIVPQSKLPAPSGATERFVVTGLQASTNYYFAVIAFDEAGNPVSPSSFTHALGTTEAGVDSTPPADIEVSVAPGNLTLVGTTSTTATFSWNAVGDNGTSGRATRYDIRYRQGTTNITSANWDTSGTIQASGEPNPALPGNLETFTLKNLSPGTSYKVMVQTIDEAGNGSTLPSGGAASTFNLAFTTQATAVPTLPVITTDGGNGPGIDFDTSSANLALDGTCDAATNSVEVNGSTAGVTITTPCSSSPGAWHYDSSTANNPLVLGGNYFAVIAKNTSGDPSPRAEITVTRLQAASLSLSESDPYDYGSVAISQTASHTFTVSNSGGLSASALAESTLAAPYQFKGGTFPGTGGTCGSTLATSSSCTLVIDFTPSSAGAAGGTITLGYNDGTTTTSVARTMTGTGVTPALLTISDSDPYDFGSTAVGQTTSHTFTVTNGGSLSASSLSETTLAAPYAFTGGTFPGTAGNCTTTLAAAGSCTLDITFSPSSAVTSPGTLTLSYNDGTGTVTSARTLTGTGFNAAVISISDSDPYDFGSVTVGLNSTHSFTLTNSGSVAATSLSESTLSAPFSFVGGSFPGTSGTCTTTLNAAASCTVQVQFAPSASGSSGGTLTIDYNNGVSAVSSARTLSGTGLTPASLSISESDPYDYGSVGVGNSLDHTFVLLNSGETSATALTGSGLATPFSFKGGTFPGTGGDCGSTLAPSATCNVVITYQPSANGLLADTVQISYHNGVTAGVSTTRDIQGTGTSQASLSLSGAASYDFGNVLTSATAQYTITVSNLGLASATSITEISLTAPFTFYGGTFPGTGGTCTTSLSPSGSCTVVIDFAPSSAGAQAGEIRLSYFDSVSTTSSAVTLTGTGVASDDFDGDGIPNSVEIAWSLDPNDSSDALLDSDGDGLSNLREYQLGTNATLSDSDGDGVDDGKEVNMGLSPTNGSDVGGISNRSGALGCSGDTFAVGYVSGYQPSALEKILQMLFFNLFTFAFTMRRISLWITRLFKKIL